jgi:hypothetical protein
MDKRENKSLGTKQFRTLYTNVTKVTNILYYGAESGLNVLDPNGPARSARLPASIRGLSAMDTDDSEVAFYAKNAASIEDYRRLTLAWLFDSFIFSQEKKKNSLIGNDFWRDTPDYSTN